MKFLTASIALLLVTASAQAGMVKANLDWQGENGYSAKVSWLFDDSLASSWFESDTSDNLFDLYCIIYSPSGDIIVSEQQVPANGVGWYYHYLDFEYNVHTNRLAAMDVGQNIPEIYLGYWNENITLIEFNYDTNEMMYLDTGGYKIALSKTTVPDTGSSFILVITSLTAVFASQRRIKSNSNIH